jgi:prepilin-type N-terminal cleavage/methylation domain-containing protein
MRRAQRRAARGFTLIEVLAVMLLTGIVISVAANFYLDLSRASRGALERAQRARRAAVLLDRVAHDLEATVLVRKPDELDPLANPWLFLAEGDESDAGAQRLKFVSRGRHPRSPDLPESDLEMVAWLIEPGAHRDLELRRWSSPALPPGLDRSFPRADDSDLVAGGIADFGVRLEDAKGEWVTRWDSSTIAESSQLPVSAEISVTLFKQPDSDERDGPYVRRVLLPLRPLDLQQQLTGVPSVAGSEQQGEESDEQGNGATKQASQQNKQQSCVTVGQCLSRHPEIGSSLPAQFRTIVNAALGECASTFAGTGFVPGDCL